MKEEKALTILIADDEHIEREGIQFLLNQSPYSFQIKMAENGEAAMSCLEQNSIDILFTDIKMPFMDGLELLAQANERFQNLKVVIFSAFADFTYAQTALKYNVVHYFLKPVDPNEFYSVLDKLIALIEADNEKQCNNHYLQGPDSLMKAYLRQAGQVPSEIADFMKGYHHFSLCLFDLQDETETEIAKFYHGYDKYFESSVLCITVNEGIFLLIRKEEKNWNKFDWEQSALSFFESCEIRHSCVIIGNNISCPEELSREFIKMEAMLRLRFFVDGNHIFYSASSHFDPDHSCVMIDRIISEVYYGIKKKSVSYVREHFILLQEELRRRSMDSQVYVKYLYATILKQLADSISDEAFRLYLDQLYNESSLTGIHQFMLAVSNKLISSSAAEQEEITDQKRVIRLVIEIVESRYQQDLSLQSIAQEVYLTPSYLSYLFKKEVGVSLIKYITMHRLDKAKELLRTGNMKISDIASLAGYQNYSYFNIAFKNNVGKSPAQYRKDECS